MHIYKTPSLLNLSKTYMDRPDPYEADRIFIWRESPPLYGTHM